MKLKGHACVWWHSVEEQLYVLASCFNLGGDEVTPTREVLAHRL